MPVAVLPENRTWTLIQYIDMSTYSLDKRAVLVMFEIEGMTAEAEQRRRYP